MNPLPPESEEYEAMMAEQASDPGAGYSAMEEPVEMPALPAPTHHAIPYQHPQPLSAAEPQAMAAAIQAIPQTFLPAVESAINPEFATRGHMLGFTTLASGLGMLLGVRLGGGYGAVAGSLFAGAAVNAYRAALYVREGTQQGKKEAAISGTYALLAAGVGGYVLYKFRPGMSPKAAISNPREDGPSCLTKNQARNCGIRAII